MVVIGPVTPYFIKVNWDVRAGLHWGPKIVLTMLCVNPIGSACQVKLEPACACVSVCHTFAPSCLHSTVA